MTIAEIKKKWQVERIMLTKALQVSKEPLVHINIKSNISYINKFLADLDTLPECNGLKIDYTKETCTSCGCKNHDQ